SGSRNETVWTGGNGFPSTRTACSTGSATGAGRVGAGCWPREAEAASEAQSPATPIAGRSELILGVVSARDRSRVRRRRVAARPTRLLSRPSGGSMPNVAVRRLAASLTALAILGIFPSALAQDKPVVTYPCRGFD